MCSKLSQLFLGLVGVTFMSCSMESSITSTSELRDFLKSEVISSGSVPADGISELMVVLHLKNSDNSPVANYKPTYDITKGGGVIREECTHSDKNGISACILKSTVPGEKTFKVSNIEQKVLEKVVIFDTPTPTSSVAGITGGAISTTTATGYKVTGAISYGGVSYTETPEGYKVYQTSEGGILSE